MHNFFLDLYKKFKRMGMTINNFESMLNNLPWEEVKREDGTIYYECEMKE